jgi:hypothetical protein
MVQVLYNGLLNGGDPRRLLNDLRRQLKSRVPDTHDWASIVAYASLPDNLSAQLSDLRIDQAKRSIEAALNHADALVRNLSQRTKSGAGKGTGTGSGFSSQPQQVTNTLQALREPQARLKKARERLEELLNKGYRDEASIYGLLASTQKRLAEILWRAVSPTSSTPAMTVTPDQRQEHQTEALAALRSSRGLYWKAFQADRAQSWALVQYLALVAVLEGVENVDQDYWHLARLLSAQDVAVDTRPRRTWARSNLVELYILAVAGVPSPMADNKPHDQKARDEMAQFLQVVDPETWEIRSTRRQLLRYVEFFNEINQGLTAVAHMVEEFLGQLEHLLPPS